VIDIKQAAKRAADYLTGLYTEQLPADIRLEEVELSDDEMYWLITMSFLPQHQQPTTFSQLLREHDRIYKMFKIDAQTGNMVSMKIRTVEAA